ncbi:MAG: methylmalonyl-CoA mutase family protein [Chloroflexota bacterium]|nr:methylmalonyl-CoA mutase family protein [Chloroflexota bacterium]
MEAITSELASWEDHELRAFLERRPERKENFTTLSGIPVKRVYTPADVADTPYSEIGFPGRFPYTRGPYPTMYRGRVWTMRQIAGFGTGAETNKRFRYLIEHGQTGLSVDFDMPTLMGYDSDHPMSFGEVGREGVAIDVLPDMEDLFDGIDLEDISVSMTINPSAWILLAMYVAIARTYVQEVVAAGVPVDRFAPRLSYFFVCQSDIFEEVAKFRAMRRFYAKMMRNEFGATSPEAMRLRFHTQTAAATLTKPQPLNNIARTALQALSAVLGGTQSLHTNGLDEAYAIPSELAMKVALRTQQIIAEETSVANVIDPLGGSYYVESLTNEIEARIHTYLDKVEELGGTVKAIEEGFFQREIADTAYETARRKGVGDHVVVGVNKYVDPGADQEIETHQLDPESEHRQITRLKEIKAGRDQRAVADALTRLRQTARDPDANLMPATIDAVKADVSMGEIVAALRELYGTYQETPVF